MVNRLTEIKENLHLGLKFILFYNLIFRTVSTTHLNYIYLNQKCSANFNKTGLEVTCTHIFCFGSIHRQ